MTRTLKKAISLVLVMTLACLLSIPAFADNSRPNSEIGSSGMKNPQINSTISYISEEDAALLANQCIRNQISIGDHCPWSQTTKIFETVALFDFEDNINAYLFRLAANGKRDGYVFINASLEAPCVEAFGYDCDFMLDAMLLKNHKPKAATKDHIIYAHGLTFLSQDKDGNYFYIEDKTNKLNENKQELVKIYENDRQKEIDADSQSNLAELKSKSIKPLNQIIYHQHDANGIWSSGYTIYTTDDFSSPDNCAPTAGTNLVYYWSHKGSPRESNLWTGRVFVDLYRDMTTCAGTGTSSADVIPGLEEFARSRNVSTPISDYEGADWNSITDYLYHDRPIIIFVYKDRKYKNHAILGVGFQDTSNGYYIRVADGWTRTFSNFYKFPSYISFQITVWW